MEQSRYTNTIKWKIWTKKEYISICTIVHQKITITLTSEHILVTWITHVCLRHRNRSVSYWFQNNRFSNIVIILRQCTMKYKTGPHLCIPQALSMCFHVKHKPSHGNSLGLGVVIVLFKSKELVGRSIWPMRFQHADTWHSWSLLNTFRNYRSVTDNFKKKGVTDKIACWQRMTNSSISASQAFAKYMQRERPTRADMKYNVQCKYSSHMSICLFLVNEWYRSSPMVKTALESNSSSSPGSLWQCYDNKIGLTH